MTIARALPWAIVAAIVAWPVALGAALVDRGQPPVTVASQVAYIAASRVCHQRPDRSYVTAGVPWPVCARCAGLYLAAPVGAMIALAGRRRRRTADVRVLRAIVVATVGVMGAAWLVEVTGLMAVSAGWRTVTAAPAGVAVAAAIVAIARSARPIDQVD